MWDPLRTTQATVRPETLQASCTHITGPLLLLAALAVIIYIKKMSANVFRALTKPLGAGYVCAEI